MANSELILPFVTEDGDGKKRFSGDMEVAAVLCLAEADRRKKPGIFRGAVEVLTVLAKLHHPFWAVPWDDRCLLVDGTRTAPYELQYSKPPDVEAFVEHLAHSSTVQELYRNTLRSHRDTFSDFLSTAEIPWKGLVVDEELLSDVSSFMKDAQTWTSGSTALIPPRILSEEVAQLGKSVIGHHNLLQSEVKGLQYAIDALSEETKVHVEKMQQEQELTEEKYEPRIAAVRVEVERKTTALEEERNGKTETVAAGNKREVERLLEEKRKWEQELTRLEQDRSEYDKRKEIRRHMKDEVGEARWNVRLREVKNQISTIKGKVRRLSSVISRTNRETEKTIRNIRAAYQKLMALEEKKLSDLESLRDSEVGAKEKAMKELQHDAALIKDKIERLVDQKREHASMLQRATIPWKTETPTLIHLPIYLVQYETEKEKRVRVHSPIVPGASGGLLTKIRKTLKGYSLQSRMHALLKPRSKAVEVLLKGFEEQLNRDKDVQQSLSQVSAANNLLVSSNFKEQLRTGVGELEAAGWVRPEERLAILRVYAAS